MDYTESQDLLSFETLIDALENVTYRSGYTLRLFRNPYEGIYLSIQVWAADASTDSGEIELRINSPVPNVARVHQRAFYEWLLERLIKLEIHEVCEFFRVGDEKFYDPHNPIEPPSSWIENDE